MKWKYWCNSVNKDSKDLDDEDGEIKQRVLDKKTPDFAKHRRRSRTPHFGHTYSPKIYLWCTIYW